MYKMRKITFDKVLLSKEFLRKYLTQNFSTAANVNQKDTKHTHFGYQTINENEKDEKVREVFEAVAGKYDMMNDAMSLGIQRIWKDIFMHRLAPTNNTKLLDVAGGTGDIAFRFLNYVKDSNSQSGSHVVISDINKEMLEVGRCRAKTLDIPPEMFSWQQANAEDLPFENNSFNAYTVAFGIRNMTHIDKVLKEAHRVLQPGGRFMCLEFSHLTNSSLQWLYDQYSFQVIPVMGHILAGQWHAYQYLVESIRQFPNQETFKKMIEDAGFQEVTYENLTMGVVAIHSGFKI